MIPQSLRSHFCENLAENPDQIIDTSITLCGWVHCRRDFGGVVFLDLRDRTGIMQIVCDPTNVEAFAIAEKLRMEYVIQVTGTLRKRPVESLNPEMQTGNLELVATKINVLNSSEPLPFFTKRSRNRRK